MSQSGSLGNGTGSTGPIITVTGNTGGAIHPDGAGNINIVGGATGLTFNGASHTESLGGTLVVANGGTGDTSFTAYSVICGGTTSTNPLQNVSGLGSSGNVLTSNGAGALPTWQAGISSLTLTGDTGGPISPSANNINIVGGPGVSVSGNNGTHTLTVNISGTVTATVQTTNATPTLLYAVPVASNQAVEISLSVIAPQNTYATAIGGRLTAVGRNAGAGAIVVGAPQGNLIYDSGGSPAVTFVASAGNIDINVTGVAATTYNWSAVIQLLYN